MLSATALTVRAVCSPNTANIKSPVCTALTPEKKTATFEVNVELPETPKVATSVPNAGITAPPAPFYEIVAIKLLRAVRNPAVAADAKLLGVRVPSPFRVWLRIKLLVLSLGKLVTTQSIQASEAFRVAVMSTLKVPAY